MKGGFGVWIFVLNCNLYNYIAYMIEDVIGGVSVQWPELASKWIFPETDE